MTRDQLEAVIRRQIREAERTGFYAPDVRRLDAAVRTILAAVDDWAAGQTAATPFIAAAEREGGLVLVWRDERGEEITRCPRLRPGTERIGIPFDAQHCDLLADEPT